MKRHTRLSIAAGLAVLGVAALFAVTTAWSADPPRSARLTRTYDVAYQKGPQEDLHIYLPLILNNYPPTPLITSFNIDGDAKTADRITVTLSLSATIPVGDSVTEMRFRNDGDDWSDDWRDFDTTPRSWTMKTTDGLRQVCAQVRGSLGGLAERCDRIYLLRNGDFELQPDWFPWSHEGDSGFETSILSGPVVDHSIQVTVPHGSKFALLGNPDYSNGSVPVGSARAGRSIIIPDPALHPKLSVWYRLFTFDKVRSTQGRWLDSFEVYVNAVDWGYAQNPAQDDARRQERCVDHLGAPPDAEQVNQGGLVFCQGLQTAPAPGPHDFGWRSITLDLSKFAADAPVTVYLANFNRGDGWYNTWTYVDYLTMEGDW